MKTYKTFGEWEKAQATTQRRIISKLRKIVSGAAPKLVESSKWGNGVWLKGDLPLLYIYSGEDHLQFGFFAGALLTDPESILVGSGKYVRHIRIGSAADIDEKGLSSMIRKAVKAPAYK